MHVYSEQNYLRLSVFTETRDSRHSSSNMNHADQNYIFKKSTMGRKQVITSLPKINLASIS